MANRGAGGAAYGSSTATTVDMEFSRWGGGQRRWRLGGYGGSGGGAIMLYAPTITIAGTLRTSSDAGALYNNDAAGGGAGGGIVLWADTLSCTGSLIARGGNGAATDDAGGGGGGVINQFYDTAGTACGHRNNRHQRLLRRRPRHGG